MKEKKTFYNVLVVLVASIGSLSYGYCLGILSNVTGNPDFLKTVNIDPTSSYGNSMMSVFFCLLFIGALIGCTMYAWIARRFGRRVGIAVGEAFIIFGGALQAGLVNSVMLCWGRIFTGMGIGIVLGAVPLYQAEVSPPHGRGLLVGLHGSMLGIGISVAQWISVGCFYLEGAAGWRIPLAMQIPIPLSLVCLIWFLPESPRWYYMQGRYEAARAVLIRCHGDSADPTNSFAKREYDSMKAQLDFELTANLSAMQMIRTPSLRKRFLLGWVVMSGLQFGGVLVILTYQGVIYTSLGLSPFMIGVMTGVWATLNGVGNFVGALIVDKVGRRIQLMCGHFSVMICLIMVTILVSKYAGTDNSGGNIGAIFFFFLTIVGYSIGIESVNFIYVSEIFPYEWRTSGVAFSMSANFVWACVFTAVASPAFATIGWRFYIVFVCTSAMMVIFIYFFLPETNGLSLEEMGKVFGDHAVDLSGSITDVVIASDTKIESADEAEL